MLPHLQFTHHIRKEIRKTAAFYTF